MRKSEKGFEFDKLDWEIVRLLQDDGRMTNTEIAGRAGSTEPTVRRRVKRMLDSGLVKIVAVVTPFDLGYRVVSLLGMQVDQSRISSIANALRSIPEVRFAGVTAGSYDIVAEVWFQGTDELVSFISDRLKEIPGVHRVESIQVLKLIKYAYDWGAQPSAGLLPIPAKVATRSSRFLRKPELIAQPATRQADPLLKRSSAATRIHNQRDSESARRARK